MPSHFRAVVADVQVMVLKLVADGEGSLNSAKITMCDDTSLVETAEIDSIIKSLGEQIENLEPAQHALTREIEIEVVPAPQMSAVPYFRLCTALQAFIKNRVSSSKMTIKQYPLGYPRESPLEMDGIMLEPSVEQNPDLMPDTISPKEFSELDPDGLSDK